MMNSDRVLRRLDQIAHEPRRTVKMGLMPVDDMFFITVLVYAYNPFYTFGVGANTVNGRYGKGSNRFDGGTWRLLRDLKNRHLTGNQAKNAVHKEIQNLTIESAELLKRILTKDLRCGINTTMINQRYKSTMRRDLIPTHDIMKAKDFDSARVKYPCFVSVKVDGLRAVFRKGEFYMRRGTIVQGVEHIAEELSRFTEGPVDGELLVPGRKFDDVSGMLRSHAPVPDAEFWIFDFPLFKNEPFHMRYVYVTELFKDLNFSKVIPHIPVHDLQEIKDSYEKYRTMGYEGLMVKSYYHKYRGTRSYDWMKMKPVVTVDALCTGMYEGEGKYAGQMGGVTIRYEGKSVRVGSGFTDKQRRIFYGDPDLIVGRTIEVYFMERTASGSLRHPRFIRIRSDK